MKKDESEYHFVVNPVSASGRGKKLWERMEERLRQQNCRYTVHFSEVDRPISQICHDLSGGSEDVKLVIIGGDGSINEAVNGLQRFCHIQFGFIPCGSGNDLARGLNLPDQPDVILDRILEGITRRFMDIGELTSFGTCDRIRPDHTIDHERDDRTVKRFFTVSSGVGFDAEICEEVANSRWKGTLNKLQLGKLSYLAVALRLIAANKLFHCRVVADGRERIYPQCMFAVSMNNRFEGGGFQFCPQAINNDRLLDLCVAYDCSTMDFLKIMPTCYRGDHVKYTDHVAIDRLHVLEMEMDQPIWVHTDGEVNFRSSHVAMRTLDEQLALLI